MGFAMAADDTTTLLRPGQRAGKVPGVYARSLLLTLGLLLAAPSRAATPPPGGIVDLVGTRTLGLGAATGVMSGNDGLFVNPAATGARRRYSIEGLFLVERRGATTTGQYLGASVVDSLSTPVAASFAWARSMEGPVREPLHRRPGRDAAERLYLGAQLRYYDLSETTPVAVGRSGGRRSRRSPPTLGCSGRSASTSRWGAPAST
jgi:hypothetical protein